MRAYKGNESLVTKRTKKPATTDAAESMNCQLSACAYLLVKLLQRVEGAQAGVIEDLRRLADSDFSCIPEDAPDRPLAEKTLQETRRILDLAHAALAAEQPQ